HRQALVIEAQTVQAAELLASAGAAGTAVIALRHHDAVAGMGSRDRGIDREDAAVARPDLGHHADEKILVLAVDRGDERAAAAGPARPAWWRGAPGAAGGPTPPPWRRAWAPPPLGGWGGGGERRAALPLGGGGGGGPRPPPQTTAASARSRRMPSNAAACWA